LNRQQQTLIEYPILIVVRDGGEEKLGSEYSELRFAGCEGDMSFL
jgi:hypothetical protein